MTNKFNSKSIYRQQTTDEVDTVKDIQHKLNAICNYLHYSWKLVNEDGNLGEDTIQALKDFQYQKSLQPTGEADTNTMFILNDVYLWSLKSAQSSMDESYDYRLIPRLQLEPEKLVRQIILLIFLNVFILFFNILFSPFNKTIL